MSQKAIKNKWLSESPAQTSQSGRFSVRRMLSISIFAGFGLLVFSCLGAQSSPLSSAPVASQFKALPNQPIVVARNRTLPANTVLTSPAQIGYGSLEVSNGTSRDAYIKLVEPSKRQLIAAFYVKSNSSFTLMQIPDGVYQVLFATGEDWDSTTRTFTKNQNFKRFEPSLNFSTERQGDEILFKKWKITLHPVPDPKRPAKQVPINRQEFNRY